jgi:tetratricopeptide (TPR) repeat protein
MKFSRAMLPVIRYTSRYTLLLAFLIGTLPFPALAVQWQALTSTSRHQVALDGGSVRLTPLGRLAVWLRFTPLGDAQRKAAALEYGEKGYRSHLEYYEIDCSEQSAVLGLIDIFGTGRARLKRMKGGTQPDAIIPGSVLDRAAERICPALDEGAAEDEPETAASGDDGQNDPVRDKQPDAERAQKIHELLERAEAEPSNYEAWSLLGNAYFDADLPTEAIGAYNRALALRPDDTDILNDQGAMYRQKGEFSNALANFEKAVMVDPYNLESIYNSGYVYAFDLNNIPRALQIWKRYLELDKNSETARQVQSFVDRYQREKN